MTPAGVTAGSALSAAILSASVILSIAFLVYGLNVFHLTLRSRNYKPVPPSLISSRPRVAIHLPIYNELYVVGRLLASCAEAAESYGQGLVGIYVLDDSTDETSSEIDRLASSYLSRGFKLKVIRRGTRQGFKAGALQAALDETDEKYVAVFDADFVVPKDFLERTVSVLEGDPGLGFVQARWGHLDRGCSMITRSTAIGVDAHFLLEQRGRNGSGYLMNFNGSAGVLRVDAIRKSGGWAKDTLAEDLDLSYRMQLQGYGARFLDDLEVPGELPPTITGIKRQQGRWARGSLQAAKKLLGRVYSSKDLSRGQKLEAGIHLTYYLVHPLMVASFILALVADFASVDVIRYTVNVSIPATRFGGSLTDKAAFTLEIAPWVIFSVLVLLATFAVLFYCIEAVRVQNLGLLGNVKHILFLVVLGYGISISNSVSSLDGLLSRETGTFSRTPKYAIEGRGETWEGKRYQIPLSKVTLLEVAAVALAALGCAWGIYTGNIGILPILLVYLTSYSMVLYLTFRQTLGSRGTRDF